MHENQFNRVENKKIFAAQIACASRKTKTVPISRASKKCTMRAAKKGKTMKLIEFEVRLRGETSQS